MRDDDFRQLLVEKGHELYREMPWRQDTQPYYVLVSELMLQQTQVDRVVPKFQAFITAFPDVVTLAEVSLGEVLALWSGLGYNRRAKFLHQAARRIVEVYKGQFPDTVQELQTLPGVGKNTAGAIMVYAFNQPVVFVETNVRTVYFHHFFEDADEVADTQVEEILQQTIDHEHPREFYWALMDYGSWLKKQGVGRIRQSKHYKKQSPLQGSLREVRGMILKHLVEAPRLEDELRLLLPADERADQALTDLLHERMITRSSDGELHLTK